MPKPKQPIFSPAEYETLLTEALSPWLSQGDIHEIVYHSTSDFRRAEELLAQQGLLDGEGKPTAAAHKMSHMIVTGRRTAGTPVENAIVEYFHLRESTSGSRPYDSLGARGILNAELELTGEGWKLVHRYLDEEKLKSLIEAQNSQILKEKGRSEAVEAKWKGLEPYVPTVYSEPDHIPVPIQGPHNVIQDCQDLLRLARLCIIVGAWAGAVQYCSLAVESLLVSVLVSQGLRKPYEEFPAFGDLTGMVGKQYPQVSSLTKRLMSLIANFRNDSVHPREPSMRPGEIQARDVYELTLRLLSEVKDDWFAGSI